MANEEHVAILKQGVDVWNQWRQEDTSIIPNLNGISIFGANLRSVDFNSTSLMRANLRGVDLQEANLQGAHLQGVDLSDTSLMRTNCEGADLSAAYFKFADLTEANLMRVNLRKASFIKANLNRANLTQSVMGWTIFGAVDLSVVSGLDTVSHRGPSILGLDTTEYSQGKIPEVFLRGVGVSEHLIGYLPFLATNPIQFYSCFISYSHADASFARRLHDALQGRGIRCWLDEHQMLPGHSIYDEIDRGIRLWDKILLCASESSLKSWWVDTEIDKAFTKEQQLMKDRGIKIRALIPLNLDNTLWQWQDGKADQVRSRLAADFTDWEHDNVKFERAFEKLVRALRTDEGREVPPPSRL